MEQVLISGKWRAANASGHFQAENPATRQSLESVYPTSTWADCDEALSSANAAFLELVSHPQVHERVANFLERFASEIETHAAELVDLAHLETAYPKSPRLADVELPRTTSQLRQAAAAAREGSWALPTIDTKLNIRSQLEPLGPVVVFGPNNFPFAFGSASGGDFAAAVAAGCPVIAKANPSHPGTTKKFAELAHAAAQATDMPAGMVQLLYRMSHEDGARLVSDSRVGATGYTGARRAGLALKAAADAAGKPIYLELSSTNPVVILPGALRERADKIADELVTSGLMGTGQFCTNPGMILLLAGDESEALIKQVAARYEAAPAGVLLSKLVEQGLGESLATLQQAGAQLLTGGKCGTSAGYSCSNTALRATGEQFLADPHTFQTEAFGNATMFVVAKSVAELGQIIASLEGNLTGCIYSDTAGSDDAAYGELAPKLAQRVGRLLNDKMPTGVAVSPAMNHGGPYPATGHPGFTAVGIPASLRRFARLACYDNIRPARLPATLQDKNPRQGLWRLVDGAWSGGDVAQ